MAQNALRRKKLLIDLNNKSKCLKNNPVHFIFFDTETNQKIQDKKIGNNNYKTIINTLEMGWACYWNSQTGYTEWFYFETNFMFHNFVNKVTTLAKSKTVWIIAHNIVFDNFITDIWGFLKYKKYEVDFIHSKGMVFLQKLKKVDVKDNGTKKTRASIMLVNNGNLFPEKLENIGETIGFPKIKINFQECTKEEMKIYCKRDVEILLEFWKQWAEFIKDNKLGSLKYTISSQSMEAFKQRFCKHKIWLHDNLDVLDFERKSYYGGRTEIFYKGKVRKPIRYYDVNSMYPYVMKNFNYPIEYKFTKENISIQQMEYYIEKGWLVIAECYIDTKLNAYPLKRDNTLQFPTGKFITHLSTPEVIEALENEDIVKFGKVQFYKGANIFAEYIDFFYNNRVELKKAGNKKEKMFKLFLNSLYGKFGAKRDKWQSISEEEIKMLDPLFDLCEWIMDNYKIPKLLIDGIDLTPKIRYIGNELQIAGEEGEDNNSFPAIASHVTGYARMIIWKAIKYCQKNNIKYYYCDTDSIFIEGELPADMVDENELGKFKVEKVYINGVEFINLKNYCELNEEGLKVITNEKGEKIQIDETTFVARESKLIKGKGWKMKGVSATAELLDENTFIQQEWGGLPKQEYYTKFGRKAGEFWIIYKQKTNHGEINKGKLKGNDIVPFELEVF